MADRFEELRIFVAVAEAGGVNAGAARLGLAKSAVSRRVSVLEERLGIDLLSRESRRFTLTPAGFAHLTKARKLLADLEELDRSTSTGDGIRALTISAPGELAIHVVLPALAANPQFENFDLSVDSDQADVVVSIVPVTGRRKLEGEIGRIAFADYAKPSGAGDSTQGAEERFIGVSQPPVWFQTPAVRAANARPSVVSSLDMALAAAVAGVGIATLPQFMAADAVANGQLEKIQPAAEFAAVTATTATGVNAKGLIAELSARLRDA